MNAPELLRPIQRHPYRAALALGVAGLAAVEAMAFFPNRPHDLPDDSCVSPFVVSQQYEGDPGISLWQSQAGLGTTGVVVRGALPPDAQGVQAGFRSPDGQWEISKMVKNKTGQVALKLAIGPDPVVFGVRVVARNGSAACTAVPDLTFIHKDARDYYHATGNLPWTNPASALVNWGHNR